MDCPQCQNDEISESGICPACGYHVSEIESAAESEAEKNNGPAGIVGIDYAEGAQDSVQANEPPQWRQELSKRLQAIKEKREAMGQSAKPGRAEITPPVPARHSRTEPAQVITPTKFIEGAPPRRPAPKPRTVIPRQKILEPVTRERAPEKLPAAQADARDIQNLIDNAVSRQSPRPDEVSSPADFFYTPESQPVEFEGKLILLSRTLCGLVDLMIVLLCTGVLILSADFFSGIIALDVISYLLFAVLFLITYFFYSLFFLAATNQTIGMMITELRVVGICDERPSFGQLMQRCWAFLASLLGLGFGLLWGLFDRESLCFHDRVSDTRVERI